MDRDYASDMCVCDMKYCVELILSFLFNQWLLVCSLPMRDMLQILPIWTTRKLLSVTVKAVQLKPSLLEPTLSIFIAMIPSSLAGMSARTAINITNKRRLQHEEVHTPHYSSESTFIID